MVYTSTTAASIMGSNLNGVNVQLLHSEVVIKQHAAQVRQEPSPFTTDPLAVYEKLGVNPDNVIERYAMCPDESCCFILPLSQLDQPVADEPHL
jgi:hypothetical protein